MEKNTVRSDSANSSSKPTITRDEDMRDAMRETGRELATMTLRLALCAAVAALGILLGTAGIVFRTEILQIAGVMLLSAGVIGAVVVWNMHGLPGI